MFQDLIAKEYKVSKKLVITEKAQCIKYYTA